MIEAGNPLMNAVGPIVASRGGFAVTIGCENQTVSWVAVIGNHDADLIARVRRAAEKDIQYFRFSFITRRLTSDSYRVDRQRSKIQVDHDYVAFKNLCGNFCLGFGDLGELVIDSNCDVIVQRFPCVDQALAPLRECRRDEDESHKQTTRSSEY